MADIFIVEDDADIAMIEKIALENAGHRTEQFENGKEFLKRIADKKPDLAILDIMLPDMDGYEILKKMRGTQAAESVPVIMVTAKTTEIDMIKGLDMGADDYIRKPFSVMELITRVKAVLRRTMQVGNEKYMRVGEIFMDDERRAVYVSDTAVELTFKEYELLKYLLANAGIVVSRDMIMRKVWNSEFEGESRTVDMHIKTLRQKLGNSGAMIKTIRNVGYVLENS